jgi:hypothetical protein
VYNDDEIYIQNNQHSIVRVNEERSGWGRVVGVKQKYTAGRHANVIIQRNKTTG